ncbi:type I phosphomannose isomerase catalytic subunit [Flavobacterium sp. UMI-01]|uniref:type I phosphomannose isomerase catalytic subunit n=1 Tax=Flavobacterium sp. UMI-01 TaxID=1441053 RepID=UPI001C7CEB30|nr:type I phosphomannose isomerase catalytic subunit [Flavobacterium sp. UMI-01]GIZ08785.1 mannose-6-phosphate isomerase [Flavobacterium sp. UMI-01]
MELYPIKFKPLYKYRLWGGNKLKTYLNKDYNEESIGESWEISDVKGDETQVLEGPLQGKTLKELIQAYKSEFIGGSVYATFGEEFPLLIKFIDAKTPLSIQVHPSNELAKERHNSFGKNEMWYVMQADEDAELIVGFETEIDKEAYQQHLNDNTILEVMHHEKVSKGDTFYIPTGRIHAIGAGVLLAEIQQTSDVTYRIYDYNRVDAATGKERELHTELALDAIDFTYHENFKTAYDTDANRTNTLVHSPYFKTNFIKIEGTVSKDYTNTDSFVIYMCVSGTLEIQYKEEKYSLQNGETILLPATVNAIELVADQAEILEIYL